MLNYFQGFKKNPYVVHALKNENLDLLLLRYMLNLAKTLEEFTKTANYIRNKFEMNDLGKI
jgi:hypothetical protein